MAISETKQIETTGQKYNGPLLHRAAIKSYGCFFRINLDTKLQFGNDCHCGQQTAIHLNQLSQKSHCCHQYCCPRCCHLCTPEVWAHEATASECGELVGTFHSWIPNHGQWETDAPANRNASGNMLCSLFFSKWWFNVSSSGRGGLCFFLHFMPPGRPCLPRSNTCILIVHCVQDKCFHSSFDFVS